MNLAEKLGRLLQGRQKADVARNAGISPSALSKYLHRKTIPPADIALRLSRALGVPFDWLVDDAQQWPPEPCDAPVPAALPEREIMREIARRYWIEADHMASILDQVDRVNWDDLEQRLAVAEELSDADRQALILVLSSTSLQAHTIDRFDPSEHAFLNEQQMPRVAHKPHELRSFRLRQRLAAFLERRSRLLPIAANFIRQQPLHDDPIRPASRDRKPT
jgi:transcriptional regulator with XRE-family HTH domain